MTDTKLIHVRIPVRLIEALDREPEGRSRSKMITEALEEYLEKRRLLSIIESGRRSLTTSERETWASSQAVDTWVHERRTEFDRDEAE